MGRDQKWDRMKWTLIKRHLGYSEEDMELFYAGVDPNNMKFKRASCMDVGVQCGGWGQIALEIGIQDKKEV